MTKPHPVRTHKWPEPHVGMVFGKRTVLEEPYTDATGRRRVKVQCSCGQVDETLVYNLCYAGSKGACQPCAMRRHGARAGQRDGNPVDKCYAAWSALRQRCTNPAATSYKNYGGRGIRVCEEWDSYEAFRDWSYTVGGFDPEDPSLSLDRKDPNGDYSPENCRWTDWITQANNKRTNRLITAFGETKTARGWLRDRRCGLPETDNARNALYRRLNAGWEAERAITTPDLSLGVRRYDDFAIGSTLGYLTVIGPSVTTDGKRLVPVVCVCGTEKTVIFNNLISPTPTRSCGCRRRNQHIKDDFDGRLMWSKQVSGLWVKQSYRELERTT